MGAEYLEAKQAMVATLSKVGFKIDIVRGYVEPTPLLIKRDIIEIGFPGRPGADLTYVGSWQWDVHGKARGTEFLQRATAATLKAIKAGKARQ